MLKENIFVLSHIENDYTDFFKFLKNHFSIFNFYSDNNKIIEAIKETLSTPSFDDDILLIIFVEYPYLPQILGYLSENLNPSNYILISFYSQNIPLISDYNNIFELINTSSREFNEGFFLSKLGKEISNRNRLLLLQSEVKEFYEIGKSLSSEKDTIKLLEMIVSSSIKMTSSDAGTIYLVVDKETGNWSSINDNTYEDKLLKFVIAKNTSIDIALEASTTPITKESIYGYTVITGKSLVIDDAYTISPNLSYKHESKFDSITGYKTKSILSIPMKDNDNNITGVIQLINKKRSKYQKIDYLNESLLDTIIPYDSSDVLIMNSLASQAAVILANNLLYNNMQNLLNIYSQQNKQLSFLSRKLLKSHEDERKRIAREIHDGAAQYSSNSLIRLELCKKYLQKGDLGKLNIEMDNLAKSLRITLKEIRTIIYDLKPSHLDGGLISSLKKHLDTFRERTGLKVSFIPSGIDMNIEDYMTSELFRIFQEALSNVHKHANAQNIDIIVNINNKYLLLIISDDGDGFDTTELEHKGHNGIEGGFGLEGIKERVELLKGNISIHSIIGEGTKIMIKIPME